MPKIYFFFFLLHIYLSRRNFFNLSKFHIFSLPEISWGGTKKRKFSAKNDATGRKKDFRRIFFLLLHIYPLSQNFFYFIKISYIQPFRDFMGGGKNALQQTTTNNKWAPRTIIIPVTIRKIIGLIMIVFFLCFNPKVKLCKETRRNAKIR